MRKGLVVLFIGLLGGFWVIFPGLVRGAQKETGESVVHEGILIDTMCYSKDNRNVTNDHETKAGRMVNCGTTCASTGIPVGLLEGGKPGGKVYVLLVPAKMLADHIGKTARVTGRMVLDGSSMLVDNLEVKQKDGSYKKVDVVTMM